MWHIDVPSKVHIKVLEIGWTPVFETGTTETVIRVLGTLTLNVTSSRNWNEAPTLGPAHPPLLGKHAASSCRTDAVRRSPVINAAAFVAEVIVPEVFEKVPRATVTCAFAK